ncbi:PepSY domain-containing protein [Aquihabitans sp. G128]|uniref:PepSY-associated TM helix domain-containing protein n=1 Tax=Aquihabitans sp. G128 TaxID=2849779 RepID=UPI001C2117E7|nr:PepSY-associated TM helix domain-containing protein [Aquihabitans sp. G128]QXC59399.1 PepSY domain-containing protein [Aquihabitans sp. G128]
MLTQDPETHEAGAATPPGTAPARAARSAARPPRPKSKVRAALHRAFTGKRGPLVKVHRWVSFALLAWVVLESVTGSAIVFAPEIDHAVNHATFSPTAGDVGPGKALAAAREARPNDVVSFVTTPSSGATGGMYLVYTIDRSAEYHTTVVDPGTGRVTSADHHEPRLLALAEELHFDLNSTSIFGFAPLTVIGTMSVLWLLVIATGIYLWYWPGVKRWSRAAKVRRKRGRFTFHLDLHKALGFLTLVPLSIVVITGINFAFPQQVADVWNVVTFGTYDDGASAAVSNSKPIAGATPITADDAQEIVQDIDPNLRIQSVSTPGGSPVGVWEVSAIADHSFLSSAGGSRDVSFDVDQYTGQVLSIEDPRDKGFSNTAYEDWSYDVHFGTFGGTTTKVLWVGLGLTPVALGVTGTVMWFVRRGKRKARRGRGAAPDVTATASTPTAPTTEDSP